MYQADEDKQFFQYTESEKTAVIKHLNFHFGKTDGILSPTTTGTMPISLSIAYIADTPTRRYRTFSTIGLGARIRHAFPLDLPRMELMFCVPPEWDFHFESKYGPWPLDLLGFLAEYLSTNLDIRNVHKNIIELGNCFWYNAPFHQLMMIPAMPGTNEYEQRYVKYRETILDISQGKKPIDLVLEALRHIDLNSLEDGELRNQVEQLQLAPVSHRNSHANHFTTVNNSTIFEQGIRLNLSFNPKDESPSDKIIREQIQKHIGDKVPNHALGLSDSPFYCTLPNGEQVYFMMMVPLHTDEALISELIGTNALYPLLSSRTSFVITPQRRSVIRSNHEIFKEAREDVGRILKRLQHDFNELAKDNGLKTVDFSNTNYAPPIEAPKLTSFLEPNVEVKKSLAEQAKALEEAKKQEAATKAYQKSILVSASSRNPGSIDHTKAGAAAGSKAQKGKIAASQKEQSDSLFSADGIFVGDSNVQSSFINDDEVNQYIAEHKAKAGIVDDDSYNGKAAAAASANGAKESDFDKLNRAMQNARKASTELQAALLALKDAANWAKNGAAGESSFLNDLIAANSIATTIVDSEDSDESLAGDADASQLKEAKGAKSASARTRGKRGASESESSLHKRAAEIELKDSGDYSSEYSATVNEVKPRHLASIKDPITEQVFGNRNVPNVPKTKAATVGSAVAKSAKAKIEAKIAAEAKAAAKAKAAAEATIDPQDLEERPDEMASEYMLRVGFKIAVGLNEKPYINDKGEIIDPNNPFTYRLLNTKDDTWLLVNPELLGDKNLDDYLEVPYIDPKSPFGYVRVEDDDTDKCIRVNSAHVVKLRNIACAMFVDKMLKEREGVTITEQEIAKRFHQARFAWENREIPDLINSDDNEDHKDESPLKYTIAEDGTRVYSSDILFGCSKEELESYDPEEEDELIRSFIGAADDTADADKDDYPEKTSAKASSSHNGTGTKHLDVKANDKDYEEEAFPSSQKSFLRAHIEDITKARAVLNKDDGPKIASSDDADFYDENLTDDQNALMEHLRNGEGLSDSQERARAVLRALSDMEAKKNDEGDNDGELDIKRIEKLINIGASDENLNQYLNPTVEGDIDLDELSDRYLKEPYLIRFVSFPSFLGVDNYKKFLEMPLVDTDKAHFSEDVQDTTNADIRATLESFNAITPRNSGLEVLHRLSSENETLNMQIWRSPSSRLESDDHDPLGDLKSMILDRKSSGLNFTSPPKSIHRDAAAALLRFFNENDMLSDEFCEKHCEQLLSPSEQDEFEKDDFLDEDDED